VSRFSELQRRLAALAEIASDGTITQRALASKLDVSLGLANALLRGLESEGLIKPGGPRPEAGASSASGRRGKEAARYAITRAGRGAMRRMSRAFAAEAGALLRKALGPNAKPHWAAMSAPKVARRRSDRRRLEEKRGR
jgi:predicted ArsR family transcriptional regulator